MESNKDNSAMSDDSITAVSIKAVAGAIGSGAVSMFYVSKTLQQRGRYFAGVVTGALGAAVSVFFSGVAMEQIGLDPGDVNHVMPTSFALGLIAVGVIGSVAKFFSSREDKDIFDIAAEIRKGARE
jgi:xanthine/uracil permease